MLNILWVANLRSDTAVKTKKVLNSAGALLYLTLIYFSSRLLFTCFLYGRAHNDKLAVISYR